MNSGNFLTSHKVPLTFASLEFCLTKEITHDFAINETSSSSNCETIVGRDLLQSLGIDILFSKGSLVWDNISISIKTSPQV